MKTYYQINHYCVVRGAPLPHNNRVPKRTKLNDLIALAHSMKPGEAAVVSQSDGQTLRLILNAIGFDCITDGYHCEERGKTLAFKIQKPLGL